MKKLVFLIFVAIMLQNCTNPQVQYAEDLKKWKDMQDSTIIENNNVPEFPIGTDGYISFSINPSSKPQVGEVWVLTDCNLWSEKYIPCHRKTYERNVYDMLESISYQKFSINAYNSGQRTYIGRLEQ